MKAINSGLSRIRFIALPKNKGQVRILNSAGELLGIIPEPSVYAVLDSDCPSFTIETQAFLKLDDYWIDADADDGVEIRYTIK